MSRSSGSRGEETGGREEKTRPQGTRRERRETQQCTKQSAQNKVNEAEGKSSRQQREEQYTGKEGTAKERSTPVRRWEAPTIKGSPVYKVLWEALSMSECM